MIGRVLCLCALLLCGVTALAQEDAFTRANQEYAAGRFREAVDLYESALRGGVQNSTLFYNLGNAHYRAGDYGQAILNYERALALEPTHPEAQANLRLVRDKAHALELKRSTLERVAMQVSASTYTVLATTGFWVAAFCTAALLFARRKRGPLVAALVAALLFCAGGITGVAVWETGSAGRALAIVTAKSTEARLAVADNAGTVLALPPGSEIKVLSQRGDWLYASLPNDQRGWIPAHNAERVRL